jgi:hypothetical protein
VTAAMAVLVRKVETQRLQQMQMLACPGHRHIKKSALLVDLFRFAACHIRRNTAVDEVENKDRVGTVKLRRSSRNTGARTVVMPRWSRCAIAPPPLIGRSEASTGRRDGAGG